MSPPSVFTPAPPNVSPKGLFVLKPVITFKLSTVAAPVKVGFAAVPLNA